MAYTDIDKPSDYFRTKLYAGNATNNRAITWDETDTNMQADLLWFKSRTDTQTHGIWDSVRGAIKRLIPSSTGAEGDEANDLDSFDTNGFTVDSAANMNGSSRNFVTWGWKAGTSVSGNTTGSGTAKAYTGSVNTTSGISIIRYQGNGTSGHTIPHHLGTTPTVMMVKNLTRSEANWSNYQSDFWVSGGNQYIDLNRNAAVAADAAMWNNTQPSSSVFTVGNNERSNNSDHFFINYLFTPIQGYSKFSSYIGNGSSDGTFCFTGMKPSFVMLKNTTRAASWLMFDNKRLGYNVDNNEVVANTSAAEETYDQLDFLSNGFKMRTNGTSINLNGDTYIYMCFADNPFTTSTGVPATAR